MKTTIAAVIQAGIQAINIPVYITAVIPVDTTAAIAADTAAEDIQAVTTAGITVIIVVVTAVVTAAHMAADITASIAAEAEACIITATIVLPGTKVTEVPIPAVNRFHT